MPRRSGRKTDYSWAGMGDLQSGIDVGNAAFFGTTGSSVLTPQTLTRVRGTIGATLDAAGVDELVMVLCGLGVFTEDAFAAGAAPEFTNDGTDAEYPWVWTGAIYLSSGSEAAIVPDHLSGSIEVDSKAMRRLKPGQVIAMVFELPAVLAKDQGGTVDLIYRIRCLNGS